MKNGRCFFLLSVLLVALASCTEAFKKKMETANSFLDDMMATSVVVGTATEASGGKSMVMTTLKFEGASADLADGERERRANQVAYDFYSAMSKEDLKDETHLKITSATTDDLVYEYLFDLNDLANVKEFWKVTDEMFQACIDMDNAKIQSLKDDSYMPDDQMGVIYDVNAYNDSVYTGAQPAKKTLGFRLTDGADDEDLKLFSANYEYGTADNVTRYTINVDTKTKKVVYLWVKTDPRD